MNQTELSWSRRKKPPKLKRPHTYLLEYYLAKGARPTRLDPFWSYPSSLPGLLQKQGPLPTQASQASSPALSKLAPVHRFVQHSPLRPPWLCFFDRVFLIRGSSPYDRIYCAHSLHRVSSSSPRAAESEIAAAVGAGGSSFAPQLGQAGFPFFLGGCSLSYRRKKSFCKNEDATQARVSSVLEQGSFRFSSKKRKNCPVSQCCGDVFEECSRKPTPVSHNTTPVCLS